MRPGCSTEINLDHHEGEIDHFEGHFDRIDIDLNTPTNDEFTDSDTDEEVRILSLQKDVSEEEIPPEVVKKT